ncbi:MAG TPA: hypothetical protein VMB04_06405 [Mycobacterium sp.]|nr:hypothetical protein [Mycobacterium sp.]
MKLARPDIRHPRIVLAGSEDGDDAGLVAALRKRGLHARWLSWDDPDTLRADLVILRTVTDYAGRLDEFLAWTKRVPNLLNAAEVVAWNVGQHYLRELRHAGAPIRSRRPTGAATALVYLGGTQSHAFTKQRSVEADFELWDLGQAALQAAADQLGIGADELLYARADVVGGPGHAELVGLDLVAPSLGWQLLDDTARDDRQRQFALCVESALERLGLGPLSQRRP